MIRQPAPFLATSDSVTLNPCVRNCCLDENDICCGCKRTLKEILQWNKYTREQKLQLINELKKRQLSNNR